MDTKDTRQTYKQYKERQQRLKLNSSYNTKIETAANKIQDLYEQLSRIQAEIDATNEIHQQLKDEKYREMLRQYNRKDVIKDVINFGEKTTSSRDDVTHIKNACSNGVNKSTVNLETIEKIISVDEDIANEIPHTNFIGDLLDNLGKGTKFPSEKNKENEEDDVNGT